jgi:hypothetical protein
VSILAAISEAMSPRLEVPGETAILTTTCLKHCTANHSSGGNPLQALETTENPCSHLP